MASRETPAPRRMRASRKHPPSHTAPLMSFEPNSASPEPRPLTWKSKNRGHGSARQRQLSGPLPAGESHSTEENSSASVSPRPPWPSASASVFLLATLQGSHAMWGQRRMAVWTQEGRVSDLGPGDGALGSPWGGHARPPPPPPRGRKAAGPSSSSLLTPSVDTLCSARPSSGLTE